MLPMIKKPAVYKFIKLSGDLEFNFLKVTCLALKRVNYIERGKILYFPFNIRNLLVSLKCRSIMSV